MIGVVFAVLCAGQSPGQREGAAALMRGDFAAAERILRAESAAHPNNAATLSLLGAALDSLKRFPEAEQIHRRAVAAAPRSVDALNNYAAHLWLAGDLAASRTEYRKVVALDAGQFNANFQLARLAVAGKAGGEALEYLGRIPAGMANSPQVLLTRLEASCLAGVATDEVELQIAELAARDRNLAFAAGMVLSNAGRPGRAEGFLETALRAEPGDFTTLYDLGVVAAAAGHAARAREVLEAALRQQPENADVLYALAGAERALRHGEAAVQLLARAGKIAPGRAGIQKMLALTTGELDALEDAGAAWERYLRLVPGDDTARRERAYNTAKQGKLEEAVRELEGYAKRHPDDARGHFELAQALRTVDVPRALEEYGRALALDPGSLPALASRGALEYQEGNPEAARRDLEVALRLSPDDPALLDRLGQTYQALDLTSEAVRVLRRAAEAAPQDARTLLHLGRALAEAGDSDESKRVMEQFRRLGPEKRGAVPAGLVAYAGLTPEQRQADYRARLERVLREHPEDAQARAGYLKLLLSAGETERAAAAARELAAMNPPAGLLAEAGHALLVYGQNTLAEELLRRAGPDAGADLALAVFRSGDRGKGLAMLKASEDSSAALPYLRAAAEMQTAAGNARGALSAVRELAGRMPGERSVLLMQAAAAELAGESGEADRLIGSLLERSPEWYPAWLARAAVRKARGQAEESARALATARTLGAPAGAQPDLRAFLDATAPPL